MRTRTFAAALACALALVGAGVAPAVASAAPVQASVTTGSTPLKPLPQDPDPIPAYYAKLGGAKSVLGRATSGEYAVGSGRVQNFAAGRIYWSPSTGVHEVHGQILTEYLRLGGPRTFLGFPVTDQRVTPKRDGRYNHFSGGSIYWTARTGAHEVHGLIRAKWASLGWEQSDLGYPTSDTFTVPGGRRSTFQHGAVTWTAATGRATMQSPRRGCGYVSFAPNSDWGAFDIFATNAQCSTARSVATGSKTAAGRSYTISGWSCKAGPLNEMGLESTPYTCKGPDAALVTFDYYA